MTLTEIKEIFNIDLKAKNRKHHVLFLRNLYFNQQLEMNRESLYNSLFKTKFYEEDQNYQMIKKAFETKDFKMYSDACYIIKNKTYPPVPTEFKPKRNKPFKKAEKMPEVRWHYLRIIETLRKDNKNSLWEKPMKEFTINVNL
jgi:hypothetical protein